jgi:hypothetical protein
MAGVPEFNSEQYWELVLRSSYAEKAHRAKAHHHALRSRARKKQRKKLLKKERAAAREAAKAQGRHANYRAYINSKAWKKRRNKFLKDFGYCCQICGSPYDIEVHHLSYQRLGKEQDRDLQALCRGCHENTHEGSKIWIADPITREYLEICRNF